MINPARTAQSAFTLIELLIVIAIVGILATASIPAFSSFTNSQRLSQAAKQVKNDLRSAQSRAINNVGGKAWGIRFADPNAYSYTIYTCATLDRTTSPCTCTGQSDVTAKSFSSSFSISVGRFVFDRVTGDICDASGALNSGSSSITLTLSGSTPRTITVSAGGKIEEQ